MAQHATVGRATHSIVYAAGAEVHLDSETYEEFWTALNAGGARAPFHLVTDVYGVPHTIFLSHVGAIAHPGMRET